jgi:hypothetical protein
MARSVGDKQTPIPPPPPSTPTLAQVRGRHGAAPDSAWILSNAFPGPAALPTGAALAPDAGGNRLGNRQPVSGTSLGSPAPKERMWSYSSMEEFAVSG